MQQENAVSRTVVTRSFSLPPELYELLEEHRKARGEPRSVVVSRALEFWFAYRELTPEQRFEARKVVGREDMD